LREFARKFVARNRSLRFESDGLSFHFQKRLGVFESQDGRELRVVAEDGMEIERQMRAVEREVVVQRTFEHSPPATGDRLQSRPEQTVMHDEKIYPALDRRVERARRSIHRRANPGHRAGIFELQTIEGIRPVFDIGDTKESVAVIHQLGCGRHCAQFYSTHRGLNSGLCW
jgi:hypothetical protein